MRFLRAGSVNMSRLGVDSIQMARQGFNDAGPLAESTVLRARVRVDGRDTVVDSLSLRLSGLHEAAMNNLRLIDRGIAFTIQGSVKRITIGGRALGLPSRLRWLIREQPAYLALIAVAYLVILMVLALYWRTSHVSRAKSH